MKKAFIKSLTLFTFILLCMTSKIKAFNDEPGIVGGGSGNITTLQVNVPYDVTLTYGTEKNFHVSLNSTTRYYVVETWGDADTKLIISGGIYGSGYITDTNSGVNNNAYIEFLSTGTNNSPVTMSISLMLETNSFVKNTTIIVREETASMYGFNYGKHEINTTSFVDHPYNILSKNYNASKYLNNENAHLGLDDIRGMPRYDSEVLLIFGHGIESLGAPGQGMAFMNNSSFTVYDYYDITTPHTKFVFFGGCETATDDATQNITEYAVDLGGAKCSLGFKDLISPKSLKIFIKHFFNKIDEGASIRRATEYGMSRVRLWFTSLNRYVVYGDGSVTLVPTSTASTCDLTPIDLSLFEEYQNRSLGLTFNFNQLTEHYTRQYFQYNGYMTTDYYQFQYDDEGNMIEANHSGCYFNENNVLPILITSTPTPSIAEIGGDVYTTLVNTETYIVYHTIDNVSIPFEVKYCDYTDTDMNVTFRNVYCTNLYSGASIDYETLLEG